MFNSENSAILRYQRADGSLVFAAHSLLNGQSANEGYKSTFQCSATNKFGVSLTRPVRVKAGKWIQSSGLMKKINLIGKWII